MNEFFGLSMTYIMIGLLVIMAIAAACIGYVVLRNRIMFMVGVRNIPRRRAQTTLIIIGLMLSTVIISTAFGIGDTADYSITKQAYDRLHSIDEIVQAQTGDDESIFDDDGGGPALVSALTIPEARADEYIAAFREIDGVDGALSVVRAPVSASHEAAGQSEPLVLLMGLDPDEMEGFESDLTTLGGDAVSPGDLGVSEIYANEAVAEELDLAAGDTVIVYARGEQHEFTVREVVEDRVLTGAFPGFKLGFVLPMARAQELIGRPGEVDFIAVSNVGGVRGGMELSEDVTPRLNSVLSSRIIANDTKQEFVDDAAEASSFMVTFFVVLGLFSIAAGMMLIFLIFVMLAAERKVEMGMLRAVGTKRSHLIQSFMSEGMVYNVGAAAIGCAVGILVSIVMVQMMARLFDDFDLGITFHVTPRSLIVSYSIGVVLTFLTVTFSSWRIGALNIVSAIRDVPDPAPLQQRPPLRNIGSLLLWIFFKPSSLGRAFKNIGFFVLSLVGAVIGLGAFFLAAMVYGSPAGSTLAVVLGIGGGIMIVVCVVAALAFLNAVFQPGPVLIAAGLFLLMLGLSSELAFPFGAGMTLLLIGAALLVRSLGTPARPVFTTMGLVMLFLWLLLAGNNVPGTSHLEGDIEMFFLSGVTMVLSATFVLVYNADLLLGVVNLTGNLFSSLVPSLRTAVAYPLANKFRTGMTIAMISLVMFALVMMSTMNANFRGIFGSEGALGGYEVAALENPGNPIDDLGAELEDGGFDTSPIAAIDRVKDANGNTASISTIDDEDSDGDGNALDFESYNIRGISDGFAEHTTLKLQSRAEGFGSDREVWDSLIENPNYAVIDAFAVPGGGGFDEGGFRLSGIEATDETFEPITVGVLDSASETFRSVQIVGIIATEGSGLFGGLLLTEEMFDEVFDTPGSTVYYIQLEDGADADEVAKGIERTLLARGVQADSLRKIVEEFQAQSEGFLLLIQGFMGIGLFVGIAAVGVIAFRTVVERRQQIGMLRAIGYTRRAVALSFIMESAFTTVLGVFSGILLGLLLAYQLVNTDEFVPGGIDQFYIPWLQILLIGGFALVASLIMTIIPSRQASSIPIAEALRYE